MIRVFCFERSAFLSVIVKIIPVLKREFGKNLIIIKKTPIIYLKRIEKISI